MPYNHAPIEPQEEITGSSALPLARVKKIIAQDEDIAQCSNGAAFAISVATEMFIRYLTEQAHNVVKSERKPRRNIAYKDIANAVARIDNLEFLADTVPKTKTFRQFKEEKAREEAARATSMMPNGHHTDPAQRSIAQMMQGQVPPLTNGSNGILHGQSMATSPIVDRTINHHESEDQTRDDTEMTG